jgi:hypothetical protein
LNDEKSRRAEADKLARSIALLLILVRKKKPKQKQSKLKANKQTNRQDREKSLEQVGLQMESDDPIISSSACSSFLAIFFVRRNEGCCRLFHN